MLTLERVSHTYGQRPALQNVSFRIDRGEHVVLVGCNGSGKSTLLRIAAGLITVEHGRVLYTGDDLAECLRHAAWRRRFRRDVGLLMQDPGAMLFNPTVADEIAFGPRQFGLADPDGRARRWAEILGITSLLDQPPHALSAGEKKKTALAALLAMEPRLLLLDEPLAGLDPRSSGGIVDLLQDLPVTLLAATHNLGVGLELADRCLVLGEDHTLLHDGLSGKIATDLPLLQAANLVHVHDHRHGERWHRHAHLHDWE